MRSLLTGGHWTEVTLFKNKNGLQNCVFRSGLTVGIFNKSNLRLLEFKNNFEPYEKQKSLEKC